MGGIADGKGPAWLAGGTEGEHLANFCGGAGDIYLWKDFARVKVATLCERPYPFGSYSSTAHFGRDACLSTWFRGGPIFARDEHVAGAYPVLMSLDVTSLMSTSSGQGSHAGMWTVISGPVPAARIVQLSAMAC